MDDDEKFLSKSNLVKGHVDALVTVATAVLVLSITILKDANISNPDHKTLLKSSWILFTASIVAGVIHNFVLMHLVKHSECWANENCWHRAFLAILSVCLHLSFLVAAALFLIFALINVK